jgi:hypothetical protein
MQNGLVQAYNHSDVKFASMFFHNSSYGNILLNGNENSYQHFLSAYYCRSGKGIGRDIEGEETSRDSDTSPNYGDRRIAGQFDQEETEAANMLGKIQISFFRCQRSFIKFRISLLMLCIL